MKKWWIILLAAAACIGVAFLLRQPEETVTVETVRLEPQSVRQTVSCTGVVESAQQKGITLDAPCFISEVLVEEGQAVEVGDPLVRVDKTASRQAVTDNAGQALALAAMEEEIVATEAGVVVSVKAKVGELLEQGTPCVLLAPYSSLRVRVAIKEKDLPILEEGMSARVTGEGFRKSGYEGTLTDISSTAHTTGTGDTLVEGVVTLDDGQTDDSMRLGLTAKAAVVVSAMEGVLVVPYEAVREDESGREYVYVLEDGVARRRDLAVKEEVDAGVLLADDSLAGVRLIIQPERVTADGMAVQDAGEALS